MLLNVFLRAPPDAPRSAQADRRPREVEKESRMDLMKEQLRKYENRKRAQRELKRAQDTPAPPRPPPGKILEKCPAVGAG